jgi:hypothetical protein
LQPGQNVAVDARINLLETGQEYFKAIVTSEPIDWDSLNIGEFRGKFQGNQARGLVVTVADTVAHAPSVFSWGTGALRVEVKAK